MAWGMKANQVKILIIWLNENLRFRKGYPLCFSIKNSQDCLCMKLENVSCFLIKKHRGYPFQNCQFLLFFYQKTSAVPFNLCFFFVKSIGVPFATSPFFTIFLWKNKWFYSPLQNTKSINKCEDISCLIVGV